jgi:hypothetical protein
MEEWRKTLVNLNFLEFSFGRKPSTWADFSNLVRNYENMKRKRLIQNPSATQPQLLLIL